MTKEERAKKVREAAKALPAAIRVAMLDVDNEAKWEVVEQLGATIHRQGRLLAGKARGG